MRQLTILPRLVLLLALCLGTALGGPYDVNVQRARLRARLQQISQAFKNSIPRDAYVTRTVDGRQVTELNTQHAGYREKLAQWKRAMTQAHQRFNAADKVRVSEMSRVIREAGLTDVIQNTGRPPEKVGSDFDLTPRSDAHGRKLAEALTNNGHKVQDLPDRWVDHTSDTTIWKKQAQVEVGSQEWRELVRQGAVANSDKFSTAGGKHSVSGGKIGVRDPHGAVIDNVKKLSDSGMTARTSRSVDWNIAGKSAYKAAKVAGVKLDPQFAQQLEGLYGQRKTLNEVLELTGKTPQQQAREIARFKKKLMGTVRESVVRSQQRSITIDKARTALVENLEARAARTKDPVLREQLTSQAKRSRARLREARLSRKITQDAVLQRDPALSKELRGTQVEAQQRWEKARRQVQQRAAEIAKARQPGKLAQAAGAAKKWGGRALTGLWIVNAGLTGADREMENALREGRPPSRLRAMGHAILEGTLLAPTYHSFTHGLALRDRRLEEYDRKYKNHWGIEARAVAMWDAIKVISCYDLGSQIGQEELDAEMNRAIKNGEDMSRARWMANSTARVLGELLMIAPICRSVTRDWEAEARWHSTERALRKKVAARCWASEKELDSIRAEALWWRAHYPNHARVKELEGLYNQKFKRLHDLAKRLRIRRGGQDPMVQALYDALKRQGLRGGKVSVWDRQRSWYCTNRPQIQVRFKPNPIVRRGGLPRPAPKQLRRSTNTMAKRWAQAGYDQDQLDKALDPVVEKLEQAPPVDLTKLEWKGKPAPPEQPTPEAIAAYRKRLLATLQARWLGALASGRPKLAATALRDIHLAAGLPPGTAKALVERLEQGPAPTFAR